MSKIIPYNQLNVSNNPRAPHADITNASELFGDPFGDPLNNNMAAFYKDVAGDVYGDVDGDVYGDAYGDMYGDSYGDAYGDSYGDLSGYGDAYGDIGMSGDAFTGGPTRMGRFLRAAKGPALVAGAGVGSYFAASKIAKAIRNRKARRAAVARNIDRMGRTQTISQTRSKIAGAPKIQKAGKIQFFELIGAQLTNSPIAPNSWYVADQLKYMLDTEAMFTPFQQQNALGTPVGSTWTNTLVGPATPRYYTHVILSLGINALSAAPGTVVTITGTLPTTAGPLTIAAQPFIITLQSQFNVRFVISPWVLVQNMPLPVLGVYDNLQNITLVANGLPAGSQTNITVVGTLHPFIIGVRKSLL